MLKWDVSHISLVIMTCINIFWKNIDIFQAFMFIIDWQLPSKIIYIYVCILYTSLLYVFIISVYFLIIILIAITKTEYFSKPLIRKLK